MMVTDVDDNDAIAQAYATTDLDPPRLSLTVLEEGLATLGLSPNN